MVERIRCPCGGTDIQHYQGCPIFLGRQAADRMHIEIETRAEQRIREIVREEIALALRAADTIPAPPMGESHSGAVVVPHGSSRPPAVLAEVEIRSGMPPGVIGIATGRAVIEGGCLSCRMLACVCPVLMYPTDGSDGEGGP